MGFFQNFNLINHVILLNKSFNIFYCFQLLLFLLNRTFPHKEPYKCKYAFHSLVDLRHVNEMAIASLSKRSRTPELEWFCFIPFMKPNKLQVDFKETYFSDIDDLNKIGAIRLTVVNYRFHPALLIYMIALSRLFFLRYRSWNKEKMAFSTKCVQF